MESIQGVFFRGSNKVFVSTPSSSVTSFPLNPQSRCWISNTTIKGNTLKATPNFRGDHPKRPYALSTLAIQNPDLDPKKTKHKKSRSKNIPKKKQEEQEIKDKHINIQKSPKNDGKCFLLDFYQKKTPTKPEPLKKLSLAGQKLEPWFGQYLPGPTNDGTTTDGECSFFLMLQSCMLKVPMFVDGVLEKQNEIFGFGWFFFWGQKCKWSNGDFFDGGFSFFDDIFCNYGFIVRK